MARRKEKKLRHKLSEYEQNERQKRIVERKRRKKILEGVRRDKWRQWA